MQLIKLFNLIIILLTLITIQNYTLAEEDIKNNIDASFNIEFINGSYFNVNIEIKVKKITTDRTFYEEDINTASEQDLGAFRYKIYEMLKNQINEIFKNAYLTNFTMPEYRDGLFNENFNVILKSSFFKLNESININHLINGVLDHGAIVNYSFNLKTETGWNNTYNFYLNKKMEYQRTTGSVDGNKISWQINNWNDENPEKSAFISLKSINPTTSFLNYEDIQLEFIIDTRTIDKNTLQANILLYVINLSKYKVIPDFIQDLNFINSDGLRLLISNNFTSLDEIYDKDVKYLERKTISIIENSSLNKSLNTFFSWEENTTTNSLEPYNISKMDKYPPLTASIFDDNLKLDILGISSRSMFGLINSGAIANITSKDINFGDDLEKIGLLYNCSLILPKNIYLENKNIYNWDNKTNISGSIYSKNSPKYGEEEIETNLIIDTTSSDLNLLSFFTGGIELSLSFYIEETIDYRVFQLPNQFALPNRLSIDLINSDSFRLCIDENVFTEENVKNFLENRIQLFENRIGNIFDWYDIDGNVDNANFKTSLEWDENVSNMDSKNPIKVKSYSYLSYPILFNINFLPPSFNVSTKKFNFTGLQNQNVTYKMIFPKGISLSVKDTLNKTIIHKTEDGREYFELGFNTSEYQLSNTVYVKMMPSLLYIISVFIPCIISLLITLILVILIYILRKKRNRKKGVQSSEMEDRFQEEDYYIPPPDS